MGNVIGPKHMNFVNSLEEELDQLASLVTKDKLAKGISNAMKE